jgi:hypothetical protein
VHRHSGIGWHTPASVHFGTADAIDEARQTTDQRLPRQPGPIRPPTHPTEAGHHRLHQRTRTATATANQLIKTVSFVLTNSGRARRTSISSCSTTEKRSPTYTSASLSVSATHDLVGLLGDGELAEHQPGCGGRIPPPDRRQPRQRIPATAPMPRVGHRRKHIQQLRTQRLHTLPGAPAIQRFGDRGHR